MDPKLKALATEYEKARKQNLQLRQALTGEKEKTRALSEEIEQLKNSGTRIIPSGGDDVAQQSQITRLQAELDQMSLAHAAALRQRDEQIGTLEAEVTRLKSQIVAPVEVADMAIQKDEATVSEIDANKVYQVAIDGMRGQIEKLKQEHQEEMTRIMQHKRIIQPNVLMPKELNIIDDDELGTCSGTSDEVVDNQLDSLGAYFTGQVHGYIVRLQNEIARSEYNSSESQAALTRLRQADDERFKLIDQLRDSKDETKSVQAELETIKHNYEEQLNTMTEELAQQLNQSGLNNSSNVMGGEDKTAGNTTTAKKSRFSLFGRGSS